MEKTPRRKIDNRTAMKATGKTFSGTGKRSLSGLLAVLALCAAACVGDAFYRCTQSVRDDLWVMGEAISFRVPVTDTVARYRVYVELRVSDSYPWREIFLLGQVGLDSLAQKILDDTLRCELFDERGRATGHGLSNVKENAILWQSDFRFPQAGTYVFSLRHGMRNVELPGVSSVGIRLEPAVEEP